MKKKLFLPLLLIFSLLLSMTALAVDERWTASTSRDENENIVVDFPEVSLTLPADWSGKVQMNISSTGVYFYHIDSRTALTEENDGEATGGLLFTLAFAEDEEDIEEEDVVIYEEVEDGVYYIARPTDVQAYTGDATILQEYYTLFNQIDDIIDGLIGEDEEEIDSLDDLPAASSSTTSEYIFPQSDSAYLTTADLIGMSDDEVQMAINEIYARRHRRFYTTVIQEYFDSLSWYSGYINPEDFDASVFNDYESSNINLMITYIDNYHWDPSSEYILPQSSTVYLTMTDLYGMDAETLQMAINEIYARHHRLFSTASIQAYFDSCSWYTGYIAPENFSTSVFSAVENYNLNLMTTRRSQIS